MAGLRKDQRLAAVRLVGRPFPFKRGIVGTKSRFLGFQEGPYRIKAALSFGGLAATGAARLLCG